MLYDALYRAFLLEAGNDAKWLDALLARGGPAHSRKAVTIQEEKPLGASQTSFPAPGHARRGAPPAKRRPAAAASRPADPAARSSSR